MGTNKEQNRISAILPTLDAAATLPQALSALCAPALLHEIIVADGGSRDDTLALARAAGARIAAAARSWPPVPPRQPASGCCSCTPIAGLRRAGNGRCWPSSPCRERPAGPATAISYSMTARRRRAGSSGSLLGAAAFGRCLTAIRAY